MTTWYCTCVLLISAFSWLVLHVLTVHCDYLANVATCLFNQLNSIWFDLVIDYLYLLYLYVATYVANRRIYCAAIIFGGEKFGKFGKQTQFYQTKATQSFAPLINSYLTPANFSIFHMLLLKSVWANLL